MSDYSDLCKTPQDPIATPPSGPKYSTAGGQFGGEGGQFPAPTGNPVITPKIYDKAMGDTPKDETRGS